MRSSSAPPSPTPARSLGASPPGCRGTDGSTMSLYLGIDVGGTASRWAVDGRGRHPGRAAASPTARRASSTTRRAAPGSSARSRRSATRCRGRWPAPTSASPAWASRAIRSGRRAGLGRFRPAPSPLRLLQRHGACMARGVSRAARAPRLGGHRLDRLLARRGRARIRSSAGAASSSMTAARASGLRCARSTGCYRLMDEEGRPKGAEILASAIFDTIGGDDHDALRDFVYGGDRGRIGTLAVAVARAAKEGDPMAAAADRRGGAGTGAPRPCASAPLRRGAGGLRGGRAGPSPPHSRHAGRGACGPQARLPPHRRRTGIRADRAREGRTGP
jgi:glucosamine kinase